MVAVIWRCPNYKHQHPNAHTHTVADIKLEKNLKIGAKNENRQAFYKVKQRLNVGARRGEVDSIQFLSWQRPTKLFTLLNVFL